MSALLPEKICQLFTIFDDLKLTEQQVVRLFQEFGETDPPHYLPSEHRLDGFPTEQTKLESVTDAISDIGDMDSFLDELPVRRKEFWSRAPDGDPDKLQAVD